MTTCFKEREENPEVDFYRNEVRFFVLASRQEELLEALKENLTITPVGEPPRNENLVQTFYFGQDGILPPEVLIRLRRYNASLKPDSIVLNPQDICILEIKSPPDGGIEQWKARETVVAASILVVLESPSEILRSIEAERDALESTAVVTPQVFDRFLQGIDPRKELELIIATEAVRIYFGFPDRPQYGRVTIDSQQRYFGFLDSLRGEIIGEEEHLKVECKFSPLIESTRVEAVTEIFKAVGAFQIDSRKQHIQELYTSYRSVN